MGTAWKLNWRKPELACCLHHLSRGSIKSNHMRMALSLLNQILVMELLQLKRVFIQMKLSLECWLFSRRGRWLCLWWRSYKSWSKRRLRSTRSVRKPWFAWCQGRWWRPRLCGSTRTARPPGKAGRVYAGCCEWQEWPCALAGLKCNESRTLFFFFHNCFYLFGLKKKAT